MNSQDIRIRVLLVALLPATILALLLTIFFATARFNDLDEALSLRGRTVARQLAASADYGVFSGNREALQTMATTVLTQGNLEAVVITGAQGEVLARSGRPSMPLPPTMGTAREYSSTGGLVMGFVEPITTARLNMNDAMSDPPVSTAATRGHPGPGHHRNQPS